MTTEHEAQNPPTERDGVSEIARFIAATVRAQAGWRGWTQRDIGRETGLRHNYISERWRGDREWTLGDVERIARAIGMDAWTFFDSARALSTTSLGMRAPEAEHEDDGTGDAESVDAVDLRARNRI